MTEITLPFKERFREQLLNGSKTMTCRTRMYGRPFDTFKAFGGEFELTAVDKFLLGDVTRMFWKEEGATSTDNFVSIWNTIHPIRGWHPYEKVWLHQFKLTRVHTNTRDNK